MEQYQCPQCYNYEITVYKPKPFWIWLVPMVAIDAGLVLIFVSGKVETALGLVVVLMAVDALLAWPLVRALQSRNHFPNGAVYHCESCGHQWTERPGPGAVAVPEVSVYDTTGFQMTVQDVFSIKGRGTVVTGIVASGSVGVGETVALLSPSGRISHTTIDGIEMLHRTAERAVAGDNVGLVLGNVGKDDVQRGDVLQGIA